MPNSVQFACFSVSAVHKTKYKHCKANFSRLFISNVHDLQKKKLLILFSHFGINSFGCSIQLHNAMYHYSSLSNLMAFFDDFHNDKTINAINAMTVIHFLLVQGEMN